MTRSPNLPGHSRESGNPASRTSGRHGEKKRDPRFRGGDVLGWAVAAASLLAAPLAAQPTTPDAPYAYKQLPNPRQEAAAKALMETLRCIVCQGQSIADSDATMAGDMRSLVRERVAAGEEPEAIRAWLVERYGNWVSYKPSGSPVTWPLWGAPVLLLGIGLWLARGRFRRRPREAR